MRNLDNPLSASTQAGTVTLLTSGTYLPYTYHGVGGRGGVGNRKHFATTNNNRQGHKRKWPDLRRKSVKNLVYYNLLQIGCLKFIDHLNEYKGFEVY